MTDARGRISRKYCSGARWLVLGLLLAGCTNDDGDDFCKNHYRFHEAHRSSLARISIVLNGDGLLDATLVLPAGIGDEFPAAEIGEMGASAFESVLRVQSADGCDEPRGGGSRQDGAWRINYQAQCGPGNKIGQIDLGLFDVLPSLDEAEVHVTTPATQKHFAISRRCEQAIYRLSPHETADD